ncbi:ricin-type beta-trefoil lectin domain protein [Streptacidiphilus sp. MAP12-33]|uniref:ricin-type beta-trefoil lectin domain protein n=1 Tax=Streptacidiphilus sp. MAP12-33 TaxID=3156266 RepID=UPI003510DA4D
MLHPQALPGVAPAREYQVPKVGPRSGLQSNGKGLSRYRSGVPVWPVAGVMTVALTHAVTARTASGVAGAPHGAPVSAPVKAGSLPLWVAPVTRGGAHTAAGTAPSSVRVQVASHAQAVAAGANGMLIGVSRADGAIGRGQVQVVLDYAALAQAYGGGYGSRLQMFLMPSCALTTPQIQACRTRAPLASTNRAAAEQLVATVPVGARPGTLATRAAMSATDTTGSMSLVAVTSGNSGSQGNYGATSLNPSGTWQTSGGGSFTYSYPISVPPGVVGGVPTVALSYDSESVDGETSGRNSQATWIGDGWDYQPGFVERSYRSCSSLLDSGGNRILKGSGDECWGGDNATLSFGPHSGVLVPLDSASALTKNDPNLVKEWKLQGDDGTVVEELKGAPNGLYQGIYYRVLTSDGSAAYFGATEAPDAPGIAGAMPTGVTAFTSTNSAWGVPVMHPVSGDPCYNSSDDKASKCSAPEGWRWNLDFVVSPSGVVQRYDYTDETNYYDLGSGQAASGSSGTLTPYVRGGQLAAISYGYTLADEQAGRTPSAEVVFNPAQRCQTSSTFDCTAAITDSNATNWPDVPFDLACESGDSTTMPAGATSVPAGVCVTGSPSYWTTTRLGSITTEVNVAGKGLTPVDTYTLNHIYTDAGATADPLTGTAVDPKDAGALQGVMWLQSIRHTGHDSAGNQLSLNPVDFQGTEIDNRVNDSSPQGPPLYRPRISSVNTETGGQIAVVYNLNPCAGMSLSFASADSNQNSCYPVYWSPPGAVKPVQDWFNKITVHQVVSSDQTTGASGSTSQYKPNNSSGNQTGSEAHVTTYAYGTPAWHRDDSAQTDDQYRTWDQFRGFSTVTVQTGAAPEPVTQTITTYLQGMNGDYLSNGKQRSVSVNATLGGDPTKILETVPDDDWLSGTALETDTYSAAGGTITGEKVAGPFTFTTTQTKAQTPWTDWNTTDDTGTAPALSTLPSLVARRDLSSTSSTYGLLADGQTWRQSKTVTNYDSNGRLSTVDTQAVDAKFGASTSPLQETCSTTGYANPPSGNPLMLSYADQGTTVNGAISGTTCPTITASNFRSDKKSYYDAAATLASLPTFGQVGTNGWMTATSKATGFDSSGAEQWQPTAALSYDAGGRLIETDTPNPGDPTDPTGTKNPLVATTTYSPAWKPAGGNSNATYVENANTKKWITKTWLDPLRGLTTKSVDPNGRTTTTSFDALGRRTAVWLPGQDQSAGATASETFTYSVNPGATYDAYGALTAEGAPSSVTTDSLQDDGSTYATSITIYDGLLQARQTQSTPPSDTETGRLITDTFYDSHGWPTYSYAAYPDPNSNPPSSTLYTMAEASVPSETSTYYDGEGRPTTQTLWHDAQQQWQSSTSYPGVDETTQTPPAGGATTQSFTNALGQTVRTVVKNTTQTVKLTPGTVIPSGTQLSSGSARLAMQADGNLVLYSLASGSAVWATGTNGNNGAYAALASDGNLHVYSVSGASLWSSANTAGAGTVLQLQNDSNLVLYNSSGAPTWASNSSKTNPGGDLTTSYTYWPNGQAHTISDSAGNQWSYSYNLLGELTSQTDPDSGTSTYGPFDVAGDTLQATDPRGATLSYQYDWDGRLTGTYTGAWTATPNPANQLTGSLYDTLADGYPTSSSRYVGGNINGGKTYTDTVAGYDLQYHPTGSITDIPSSDGFPQPGALPTGISPAPTGYTRYATTSVYSSVAGLLQSTQYGNDGGLPSENVQYAYNKAGELSGFSGWIASNNTPTYLAYTAHDQWGRLLEADYNNAASGSELNSYAQYDPLTGRVIKTNDWSQKTGLDPDVETYLYNQAGELTAVDDQQTGGVRDTQCFSYDAFQRLTTAWSDTQGLGTAVAPGNVGACASASPTSSATTAAPTANTVGGPAPYWQNYTYDLLGDRTSMVNHDPSGNALKNTTQTISYAGSNATAPASQPNQATTETTSNPTLGSSTENFGYLDKTYNPSGLNAGDTTSRTASATGPLTSGVKTSTGGALCLADPANSATTGTQLVLWGCGTGGQTFTFDSDGTVRIVAANNTTLCMDISSTNVVLNPCNGAAGQQWRATSTHTLINTSTGKCLADPAASTTQGTKQIIYTCTVGHAEQTWTPTGTGNAVLPGQVQTTSYNAEGRTASVTTPNGTTSQTSSYLYDPSGGLLEQTNSLGNNKILYLFGGAEQIYLNAPSGGANALRTYSGPGGVTITRTNTNTLNYQVTNAQGTAESTLDATTLNVTHRYYDPYGNPRGAQPSTWVDPSENRGFLGQPTDTSAGADLLGARVYDPTVGRFGSLDPIFQAGDPNQMGGYTYAADNPSSTQDPTGFDPPGYDDNCHYADIGCPGSSGGDSGSGGSSGGDGGSGAPSGVCTCQCQGDCGPAAQTTMATVQALNKWIKQWSPQSNDPKYVALMWMGLLAQPGENVHGDYWSGAKIGGQAFCFGREACNQALRYLQNTGDLQGAKVIAALYCVWNDCIHNGQYSAQEYHKGQVFSQQLTSEFLLVLDAAGDHLGGDSCSCACSFDPNTPVLLADGKAKPIGELRIGDEVESADPATGRDAGARQVLRVLINHDTDLLDVTVGDGHGHTSVLHTTANHPFWDETTHSWVRADHLLAGHALASTDGRHPIVLATRLTRGAAYRWNLTVDLLHTYYVMAGSVPVLVHNSSCIQFGNDLAAAEAANELIESLQQTGELPPNYVTKDQAAAAGWKPGKALGNSIPGGQIGGDVFNNTDDLVPNAPGRTWFEADVGLNPMMSRAKQPGWRLLYSDDGLAYVTSDHYETAYQLPNWK